MDKLYCIYLMHVIAFVSKILNGRKIMFFLVTLFSISVPAIHNANESHRRMDLGSSALI